MNCQLIINADDFGLSNGANQGVIACHQAGSVNSTTMMVNMPAADEAFAFARENPDLGVGLHFNLTLGGPLSDKSQVKSLLGNDGRFLPRTVAEKMAVLGKYNPDHIRYELKHQFERFLLFGMTPTHLDSHQHIHAFPQVFNEVARFCVDHSLPLRIPWPWKPSYYLPLRRKMRTSILRWMISRNMKQWGRLLRTNASFASIFDLQLAPEKICLDEYSNILKSQHRSPLELMVHPAITDEEHRGRTRISLTSAAEYEVLLANNLESVASEFGYELINYSSI